MDADERPARGRFSVLPRRVRLEETVTTLDPGPVPDPDGGRTPGADFVVRHGLG